MLLFINIYCLPVGPHEIVEMPPTGDTIGTLSRIQIGESPASNTHEPVQLTEVGMSAAQQHMNRAFELVDQIPEDTIQLYKEMNKEWKPFHRNVNAAKHFANKATSTLPEICLLDRIASATEAGIRCARVVASGIEAGLTIPQFIAFNMGRLIHRVGTSSVHSMIANGLLAAPRIKERGAKCIDVFCQSFASFKLRSKNWIRQDDQGLQHKNKKVPPNKVEVDRKTAADLASNLSKEQV